MYEVTLKRHTQVLNKAIALKYAIEGVFFDEKMQELSLRFMRYVAVWLLRLASQTDYKPDTTDLQYVFAVTTNSSHAFRAITDHT